MEKKGVWRKENHGYVSFRDGYGATLLDGKPAHSEQFNLQYCAAPSGKGYMGWGDGWGDHHHWPAGHFQLKRDPTMCLAATSLSGAGNYLQLEKCHYNDGPQQARQFFATTSNGLGAFIAEKGQAETLKDSYSYKLGKNGVVLVSHLPDGQRGHSEILLVLI